MNMTSLFRLMRPSLSLHKELLWSKNWCRQVFPTANYATDDQKKPEDKRPKIWTKKNTGGQRNANAEIPENVHPHKDKYLETFQQGSGDVYETKPFKIRLQPNKEYFWCLCGRSHSQPLCDGTHRDNYRRTPFKPVRFQVKEDKEYWLCNCKKTKLRPFCDGTHKSLPPKNR